MDGAGLWIAWEPSGYHFVSTRHTPNACTTCPGEAFHGPNREGFCNYGVDELLCSDRCTGLGDYVTGPPSSGPFRWGRPPPRRARLWSVVPAARRGAKGSNSSADYEDEAVVEVDHTGIAASGDRAGCHSLWTLSWLDGDHSLDRRRRHQAAAHADPIDGHAMAPRASEA